MTARILTTLSYTLILTCLMEGTVLGIWKKSGWVLLASIACNVCTNPLLNVLGMAVYAASASVYPFFLTAGEVLVVFAEAALYRKFLELPGREAFRMSLVANLVSLLVGLAVRRLFFGTFF